MTQSSGVSATTLRHLLSLARDLLQAPEVGSVLELVATAAPEVVHADAGLLFAKIGAREYLIEFDDRGVMRSGHIPSSLLQYSRQAITEQAPIIHSDIEMDGTSPEDNPSAPRNVSLVSFPFPPIKPIGALTVFWHRQRNQNLQQASSILRLLGELTGAALGNISYRQSLQNVVTAQSQEISKATQAYADEMLRRDGVEEEIHRVSVTDAMTGLLNRRGFYLHAERSLKVALRNSLPSVVIFADINGLKAVNDTYGHEAGDRLIKDAALILQQSFRDSDVVARLGGDEFAAFALDSAQPDAVLARIQRHIDNYNTSQTLPCQIAFSTGIVQCDPSSDMTLSDYLALADRQMYEQKKKGVG
jgi:diguanylate cyclase (GGDEF)-like protein